MRIIPLAADKMPVPKETAYARFGKRIWDILLSGTGILVLSPLLLVIVVLEYICNGFPALYVSERIGKDGRSFQLYKFRSMNDAKDETGALLPGMERITPFGRFLRKTSLDELAGLFNIFKGDMSVIGPRPLVPIYLPRYTPRQRMRHAVRPGLTLSRIDGGEDFSTWEAQFENDLCYVQNVSFALDVHEVFGVLRMVTDRKGRAIRGDDTRAEFMGSIPPAD